MELEQPVRPYVDFPDKSEIIAVVLAFAPFICNFSFTASTTVNGQVTSFQSTDFVDVALGVVAVLVALSTIRLWKQTRPEDKIKRMAIFAGVVVLGAYQALNGLGIFTQIG